MAQQWLSIVEYARAYNISDMTIRRRIKTGKLSATLKDGKYFIPVDIQSLPKREEDSSHNSQTHASANHPTHEPVTSYGTPPTSHSNHRNHDNHGGYSRSFPAQYMQPQPSSNHSFNDTPFPQHPENSAYSSSPQSHTSPPHHQPHNSKMQWSAVKNSPSQSQPIEERPSPPTTPNKYEHIPQKISREISKETTLISSTKLLQFCEDFLTQTKRHSQDLVKSYDNKILYLEKSLEFKDSQIVDLQQKIEDLELLVKIFESKKKAPTQTDITPTITQNLPDQH